MILFAGDCHGDFMPLIQEAAHASAVVLLGDQEPQVDLTDELGPELASKTWWIYGNHDSDEQCFFERHQTMANRNLHCQMVEIQGVRIAGLGGVFRTEKFEVDQTTHLREVNLSCSYSSRSAWAQQNQEKTPLLEDFTTIFPDDLKALLDLKGQVDVLVTHEAPESHLMGFPLLGDLARAMGVKLLIHGHHHERYSASLNGGIRVEGIGMARTQEGFFSLPR